jgi:hypothetical protein
MSEIQPKAQGDWRVGTNPSPANNIVPAALRAAEAQRSWKAINRIIDSGAIVGTAQEIAYTIDSVGEELTRNQPDNMGLRRNLAMFETAYTNGATYIITEHLTGR